MEELINLVAERVGISGKQARTAVDTVVGFLQERLPQPIGGFLDTLLGKEGTLEQAGDLLGGLGELLGGLGIEVPGQGKSAPARQAAPAGKPKPAAARPSATRKPPSKKPATKAPAPKPASTRRPTAEKPTAGKAGPKGSGRR